MPKILRASVLHCAFLFRLSCTCLRHNSRSKCTASRRSAAATAAFSGFAEFSAVLRCKSPFKGSVFRAWLIFNHRYTYPAMLLPPYLSVQNIYICPLSPLNIFLSPFARPASAYIYSGGGDARISQTGSSGTKTCTITSVQVLFSKLLNFNFETRFRFFTVYHIHLRQTPYR